MRKRKCFIVRIEKDLWMFLKHISSEKETSMNAVVEDLLNKLRNKYEKKLTSSDTMIS